VPRLADVAVVRSESPEFLGKGAELSVPVKVIATQAVEKQNGIARAFVGVERSSAAGTKGIAEILSLDGLTELL